MLDTVYPTKHAILRWNERAAFHVDETGRDIVTELRRSKRIAHNEPTPITKLAGFHYYYSEQYGCYFCVQPIDQTSSRVVTVIDEPPQQKPEEEVEVVLHASNSLEEMEAQWERYTIQVKAIEEQLIPFSKTDKARNPLIQQKMKMEKAIAELKPRLRAARQKADEEDTSIFRPNGQVNLIAAVTYLLGEVDALQRRVADLERK